jgi:hypothetical protein
VRGAELIDWPCRNSDECGRALVWDQSGPTYLVGEVLGDTLETLIKAPVLYKKPVGMQMLLEGLVWALSSAEASRATGHDR